MKTVTFFDSLNELKQLTGLTCNGDLWRAGFDIDDWDWGFASDKEWDGDWGSSGSYYEFWLLNRMVDPEHVEYNGKHYYIMYHS